MHNVSPRHFLQKALRPNSNMVMLAALVSLASVINPLRRGFSKQKMERL